MQINLSFLRSASIAIILTSFASQVSASTITFNFETKALTQGQYSYSTDYPQYSVDNSTASSPGVTFAGMSGVQNNPSAFGFPATPDGVQTAFIQSYYSNTTGSLTFDLTGVTGPQILSFIDVARPSGGDPFTVSYGAQNLGTFTPDDKWSPNSVPFIANGTSNLVFSGVSLFALYNASGIDAVTISSTPLPSTWLMLLSGFVGLGFLAYRGTKKRTAALAAA